MSKQHVFNITYKEEHTYKESVVAEDRAGAIEEFKGLLQDEFCGPYSTRLVKLSVTKTTGKEAGYGTKETAKR